MIDTLQAYPEYKDSGLPWLGRIPKHWNLRRAKYLMREMNTRSKDEGATLLSVSQYTGVTKRRSREGSDDPDTRSSSLVGYKIAESGDLVSNIMLAWNGSLGIAPIGGVVSPAYCVYRICKGEPWFFHHLLRSPIYKAEIKRRSRGVVDSRLRLYTDDLFRIPVLLPDLEEQRAMVRFVRDLDRQVRRFIRNRRRLIEVLNEQKQAIINHAVTRGLDPSVSLKPSGIDWLGDIPEHWEVVPLKRICRMKSGEGITSFDIEENGEYPVYGGNGLRGYTHRYTHDGEYVLVGRQGALCGNVHLVSGRFWASEHAVVADLLFSYCMEWFAALMEGMDLNQYSIAAAQPGLSVDRIINLQAPIPPTKEQKKIANFIRIETATILKALDRAQQEIDLIREYRTRLIVDVVTGKVDVRHLAPPPGSADLEGPIDELEPLDDAAGELGKEAYSGEVDHGDD